MNSLPILGILKKRQKTLKNGVFLAFLAPWCSNFFRKNVIFRQNRSKSPQKRPFFHWKPSIFVEKDAKSEKGSMVLKLDLFLAFFKIPSRFWGKKCYNIQTVGKTVFFFIFQNPKKKASFLKKRVFLTFSAREVLELVFKNRHFWSKNVKNRKNGVFKFLDEPWWSWPKIRKKCRDSAGNPKNAKNSRPSIRKSSDLVGILR